MIIIGWLICIVWVTIIACAAGTAVHPNTVFLSICKPFPRTQISGQQFSHFSCNYQGGLNICTHLRLRHILRCLFFSRAMAEGVGPKPGLVGLCPQRMFNLRPRNLPAWRNLSSNFATETSASRCCKLLPLHHVTESSPRRNAFLVRF